MQQEQEQQPSHLQPQHDDPTRYGIVVAGGDHHVNEDSPTEETADDLLNKLKESGEYQRYVVYSVMNVGCFFRLPAKLRIHSRLHKTRSETETPIFGNPYSVALG